VVDQEVVEGSLDLFIHARAGLKRLYVFFELPPDLSLPQRPAVRSTWEAPPEVVSFRVLTGRRRMLMESPGSVEEWYFPSLVHTK
jgi:hypothetical protein